MFNNMNFKNLIPYLLIPVLAISCAKEDFDDSLKTQDGDSGRSGLTFNVSIPKADGGDAKTFLGERDDNRYPTYWDTGDAISINGVSSNVVPEELAGNNTVPFTFDGVLTAPYNALYPATTKEDVFTLPAEQVYYEENFDANAVPMYGSGSCESIQMKHLTSLLRFSLSAKSSVNLVKVMAIACGGEKLSGTFKMHKDEEQRFDGKFTAESGSSAITMNFDDVSLDMKEFIFYLAIPSGKYSDGFNFLFYDDSGNVMRLRYKTTEGDFDLAPSKVVELENVIFDSSASTVIIETVDDLLAMAANPKTADYIQVVDLDMTGMTWNSPSTFSGTYEGTGHVIKGLNAPFFKTLKGSVSNLELNSTIEAVSGTTAGIMANEMTSGAVVKNCTIRGSLVYAPDTQTSNFNVGGLAGKTSSAVISDCKIYADVEVSNKLKTTASNFYVGGLVGYDSSSQLTENSVYGNVTNAVQYDLTAYSSKSHNTGGIAGYMTGTKSTGDSNYGTVSMIASTMNTSTVGGIAGDIKGSSTVLDGDTNYGTVYFSPTGVTTACARYLHCGGLVGKCEDKATMKNCTNATEAKVWYDNQYADTYGANIGGVIGVNYGFVSYLTNKGTVQVTGSSVTRSSSARGMFVGGVIACHCHYGGGGQCSNLTNEGTLDIIPLYSYKWNVIGAVIGTLGDCDNSKIAAAATKLTATASSYIYIHRKYDDKPLYVGGLVGNAYQAIPGSLTDSESHGKILSDGMINTDKSKRTADTDRHAFGGIIGRIYCNDSGYDFTLKNNISDVDIQFTKADASVRVSVGGAVGLVEATHVFAENITTACNIQFNNAAQTISFGGQVGSIWYVDADNSSSVSWNNCSNTTKISLQESDKLSKHPFAGGIIGLAAGADNCPLTLTVEGCTNEGEISRLVKGITDPIQSSNNTENIAGGIIGAIGVRDAVELQDFIGSERKVTIASESISYGAVTASIKDCENKAQIIFNPYVGEDLFSKTCESIEISPNFSFTGGIVGMSAPTNGFVEIVNCKNSGNIWSTSGMNGGIVGYLYSNTAVKGTKTGEGITYTVNTGLVYERDITKDVVVGGGNGYTWSGGIVGGIPFSTQNHDNTIVEYCWNSGEVSGSSMDACPRPCSGGIVGYYGMKGLVRYCKNSGHVRTYPHSGAADFCGYLCGDAAVGNEGGMTVYHSFENCAAGGYVYRGGVWKAAVESGDFIWYNGVYANDPVVSKDKDLRNDCLSGTVCWDGNSKLSWEE